MDAGHDDDPLNGSMAAGGISAILPQRLASIEQCVDEGKVTRLRFVRRDAADSTSAIRPFAMCTILANFGPHNKDPAGNAATVRPDGGDAGTVDGGGDDWFGSLLNSGGATDGGRASAAVSGALIQSLSEKRFAMTERSFSHVFLEENLSKPQQYPAYFDAYWLDIPGISGERRRRVLTLPSYRSSILAFVDKDVVKHDLNIEFHVRHPELEQKDLRLTHLRSLKDTLLRIALDDGSPIEMGTVACAVWYFERLVGKGLVTKSNRRLLAGTSLILSIKFLESGVPNRKVMDRKLTYACDKWQELFGIQKSKLMALEFRVFVALDFSLMPRLDVVMIHLQRLLGVVNVTPQQYFGKFYGTDGT